jgi:hypothetical protein
VKEHTAEDRVALNRSTAEAMMHRTILPALATVQDEQHRPEQRLYVTVTPLSPTSVELIIAQTPPDASDRSDVAAGLRYVLTVAFGSQAIVVKRSVNGKAGSFLGQHYFTASDHRPSSTTCAEFGDAPRRRKARAGKSFRQAYCCWFWTTSITRHRRWPA